MEPGSEKPVFSFVAGRHHGPECWIYVREELEHRGYESIAPDLPIENVNFSLNDHANLLANAEQVSEADEIIRVGWSWGANVIPRATGATAVKRLIFLAGAFHPATLRHRVEGKIPTPAHSVTYEAMEKNPDQGLEEMADYVFYHDLDDKMLKSLVIGSLRPHPRRRREPQLTSFPDLAMDYIALTQDRAFKPGSQLQIARALGVTPIPFESGHAPMFSKDKAIKLAAQFIKLANKEQSSRKLLLQA